MKRICIFLIVFAALLGSCRPGQSGAVTLPTASPLFDPKVTSTPATEIAPVINPTSTGTSTPSPTLPAPNIHEAQLNEIHMMDASSGWALAVDRAFQFYVLHTSDGGSSWEDVTPDPNIGIAFFLDGQDAWVTLLDPDSRRTAGLVRSRNAGASWELVNQDMQALDTHAYYSAFGFKDESHGWWRTATVGAGTAHAYYYRTQDGGRVWQPVFIEVSQEMADHYYIGSTAWEPSFDEIWFCNICGTIFYFDLSRILFAPGQWSPGTVWATTDLGQTWRKTELSGLPADIDPESSPIQYPTFFNEKEGILPVIVNSPDAKAVQIFIYGTRDGGLTWELESEPTLVDKQTNGGVDIKFISRLDGFLNSDKNLWITHDGGRTWTKVAWPQDFTGSENAYIESQLEFVDASTGWVFFQKRSRDMGDLIDSRLLKTTDGGLTWEEVTAVINP